MKSLKLIYRREDEHHGELSAIVESGAFRGLGSAWFEIDQLRKFWRAIGAYPIADGVEPSLDGGFYDDNGATLQQRHVCVRLTPHDRLGSVRVTAKVATQASNSEDVDLQQSLTVRFLVSYGDIDRFRAAFARMLDGQSEDAVLEGTPC